MHITHQCVLSLGCVYITHPEFNTGVYVMCTLHAINSIKHTKILAKKNICMLITQVAEWNKHKDFATTISQALQHTLGVQLNTS